MNLIVRIICNLITFAAWFYLSFTVVASSPLALWWKIVWMVFYGAALLAVGNNYGDIIIEKISRSKKL